MLCTGGGLVKALSINTQMIESVTRVGKGGGGGQKLIKMVNDPLWRLPIYILIGIS